MPRKRPAPHAEPWWRRRLAYLTAAGRAGAIEIGELRRIEARQRERGRRKALPLPPKRPA